MVRICFGKRRCPNRGSCGTVHQENSAGTYQGGFCCEKLFNSFRPLSLGAALSLPLVVHAAALIPPAATYTYTQTAIGADGSVVTSGAGNWSPGTADPSTVSNGTSSASVQFDTGASSPSISAAVTATNGAETQATIRYYFDVIVPVGSAVTSVPIIAIGTNTLSASGPDGDTQSEVGLAGGDVTFSFANYVCETSVSGGTSGCGTSAYRLTGTAATSSSVAFSVLGFSGAFSMTADVGEPSSSPTLTPSAPVQPMLTLTSKSTLHFLPRTQASASS